MNDTEQVRFVLSRAFPLFNQSEASSHTKMSSPPDLGANEEDNLDELNRVFELLQRLDSRDPDELHEAEQEIDEFLRRRKGKECVVTHSRTVIAAGPADKAKKLRNEGNDCFNRGEFARARELYTSAILEDGGCHIAYTNRAQANIRLADFAAAIEDCRMAIKIRPDSVKAQVRKILL